MGAADLRQSLPVVVVGGAPFRGLEYPLLGRCYHQREAYDSKGLVSSEWVPWLFVLQAGVTAAGRVILVCLFLDTRGQQGSTVSSILQGLDCISSWTRVCCCVLATQLQTLGRVSFHWSSFLPYTGSKPRAAWQGTDK